MLFAQLTALLDPEPRAAALNMALDEVLLAGAEQPLLRVYRWARPAVSFGYFGRLAEVVAQWPEREWVRRWTGGGTVAHGADFTYTLVVPRGHDFYGQRPRESYRLIHAELADLLKTTGNAVSLLASAWAKTSEECFANPTQFDLIAAGKKIAGAGQRRTQRGLLHQGSIQMPELPENFGLRCAQGFAGHMDQRNFTEAELSAAAKLAAGKYGRAEWLGKY